MRFDRETIKSLHSALKTLETLEALMEMFENGNSKVRIFDGKTAHYELPLAEFEDTFKKFIEGEIKTIKQVIK